MRRRLGEPEQFEPHQSLGYFALARSRCPKSPVARELDATVSGYNTREAVTFDSESLRVSCSRVVTARAPRDRAQSREYGPDDKETGGIRRQLSVGRNKRQLSGHVLRFRLEPT